MTRLAPVGDVSAGTWSSTAASLYDAVDEAVADNTDYIYTNTPGTAVLALPATIDPGTDTGFAIVYRVQSDNGARDLRVALKQGAMLIAQETRNSVPSTPTDYTFSISATAMAAVTDFTALRLEFEYLSSLAAPVLTKTTASGVSPMNWDSNYPSLQIDDIVHRAGTKNGVAITSETHTVTSDDLLGGSDTDLGRTWAWPVFQTAAGSFAPGDAIAVWEYIERTGYANSANSNTITDTISATVNFQATASAINTSLGYTSATHTFTGVTFPAGRPVIMIATSDGRTITAITVNGHSLTDLGDNNLWISSTVETAGSYDIAVTMDNAIGSVSIWPGAISGISSSTPVGTSRLAYGFQSAGAHTGTSTITLTAGQLGIMFGLGLGPSAYVPSGASLVRDYGTGTFWLDGSLDAFWTKFTTTGAPGFTTGSGGNTYLTAAGFG